MVSSNQLKGVDNLATNKNITMKQFNGADYDTLYPKTKVEQVEGAYTQQQILADSTKTLYGLDATAVPDDVLALIKPTIDSNYSELSSLANSKARFETGTYTGNGNIERSFTCSFKPVLLILTQTYVNTLQNGGRMVFVKCDSCGCSFANNYNSNSYTTGVMAKLNGNTVTIQGESAYMIANDKQSSNAAYLWQWNYCFIG